MSLGSYGRLLVKICDWDVSSFNMFHVFRGISPSFSTSILIILHQLFDWKYLAPVDVSSFDSTWVAFDVFGAWMLALGPVPLPLGVKFALLTSGSPSLRGTPPFVGPVILSRPDCLVIMLVI